MRMRPIMARLALAVLAPALAVALLEAALRGLNLGYPTSFLRSATVQGQACWVNNPFYGYRFFPPPMARNPSPIKLAQPKPEGRTRIAVLGESAAMGDPAIEFSLARGLDKMLNPPSTPRRFEVVNAAMTAISSPVIVDIASELAQREVDVFVIYMGNNEVVGPYGPGTVLTDHTWAARFTPLRVALSRLRLTGLLHDLADGSKKERSDASAWVGMEMFRNNQVAQNDPRLITMVSSYERNLRRILAIAEKNGIRVVLCTMAVNLTDCAPFGSTNRVDLSAEQRQAWSSLYREGRLAAQDGRADDAMAAYVQASALDDQHAELAYRLGLLHRQRGESDQAASLLARARDLDTQRFRTESRLNHVIRAVAAKQPAVQLADIEQTFARLNDRDTFVDHVHFSMLGLDHLCRQVHTALRTWYELPDAPTHDALMARLLRTPWSESKEALFMLTRRERPPFALQWGNQEQITRLRQRMESAQAQIQACDLAALERTVQRLQGEDPEDLFLTQQWGHILCVQEKWESAAPVLMSATEQQQGYTDMHSLAALAQAMNGHPEKAAELLLRTGPPYGYYLSDAARMIMDTLTHYQRAPTAQTFARAILDHAGRFPGQERLLQPAAPPAPRHEATHREP